MGKYTNSLADRLRILGPKKIGYCVICGTLDNLSADHVPPSGCITITNSVLQPLAPVRDQQGKIEGLLIQGGAKFRTICSECNSGRLGSKYDPELKLFVDQILQAMKKMGIRVHLPMLASAKIKSHAVAKAIVGHMLASHSVNETIEKKDKLGANDSLREYFLGDDVPWPSKWKLYCWPYLSRNQVILRHFSITDISLEDAGNKGTYGHTIRFLPLGFWLAYDKHPDVKIDLPDISPSTTNFDETSFVSFDFRRAPPPGFPEHVTGNNIVVFADAQASRVSPIAPKR